MITRIISLCAALVMLVSMVATAGLTTFPSPLPTIAQTPMVASSKGQCMAACEVKDNRCHQKLTKKGDAEGWDGDYV